MRSKAKKIFIKGFLQSFFIVAILLGAGVLGYQTTMHFWKPAKEEAVVAYKEQAVPESITEASIDDVSKNLIYSYNEDTKEIDKIILEIFHCENKKMTYITIPMRTQFTMSNELYRKLVLVHPAIPQILKLSTMTRYLDSETVFEYGVLIVADLLDIDISYYTAIPKATFDTIFTEGTASSEVDGKKGGTEERTTEQMVPVEIFTDEYTDFLKSFQTAEELSTYIEEIYPSFQSNLSLLDKMNYLESYCKTPLSNLSFELIEGNDLNHAFIIDNKLVAQQLEKLTTKNAQE